MGTFLSKMVYKRVRGGTSGRSPPGGGGGAGRHGFSGISEFYLLLFNSVYHVVHERLYLTFA